MASTSPAGASSNLRRSSRRCPSHRRRRRSGRRGRGRAASRCRRSVRRSCRGGSRPGRSPGAGRCSLRRRGRGARWSRRPRPGRDPRRRPWRRASPAREGLERRRLLRRRAVGDDDDGRPVGRRGTDARQRAGEVVGPVRGDEHDRRHADRRLVEARRHARAGAVADPVALGQVRRRGRGQREIRPPIDDLPARRLDLGAESVGLRPVPSRRAPRRGRAPRTAPRRGSGDGSSGQDRPERVRHDVSVLGGATQRRQDPVGIHARPGGAAGRCARWPSPGVHRPR